MDPIVLKWAKRVAAAKGDPDKLWKIREGMVKDVRKHTKAAPKGWSDTVRESYMPRGWNTVRDFVGAALFLAACPSGCESSVAKMREQLPRLAEAVAALLREG